MNDTKNSHYAPRILAPCSSVSQMQVSMRQLSAFSVLSSRRPGLYMAETAKPRKSHISILYSAYVLGFAPGPKSSLYFSTRMGEQAPWLCCFVYGRRLGKYDYLSNRMILRGKHLTAGGTRTIGSE